MYISVYILYICLHVHEINISSVERQQILSLLAEFKLLETDRTDFAGKVHCGARLDIDIFGISAERT